MDFKKVAVGIFIFPIHCFNMKYSYPAIITVDKDDPTLLNVDFPDVVGGVTFGKGLDDALYMAGDLLKLMISSAPDQVYKPTSWEELVKKYDPKDIYIIEVEV